MTTTIPVTPMMPIGGGALGGYGYGHHGHHGYHGHHDDIGHYAQHLSKQITDVGYRGVDATHNASGLSSMLHAGLLAKINDADHRATTTTNQGVKELLQNNCHNTDAILADSNRNNIQSIHLEDAHTANIMASQDRGFYQNLAATNTTAASVLSGIGMATDRLQNSTSRDSIAIQKNITDSAVSLAKNQTDALLATLSSSERNAMAISNSRGDVTSRIERNSGETRSLIKDVNNSTSLGLKETLLAVCQTKGELARQASDIASISQRQASDNFGCLSKQIAESTAAVQLEAAKNASSILLDSTKNTAAIQLEAFKNTQLITNKLAECCCEIKGVVSASASVTQQLFNNVDNNRIRDLLAASSAENTFLKYGRGHHGH